MTTIIIQARMGSSRLPGKAMLYFRGQPIIHSVVSRCQQSGFPVIVATPDTPDNQLLWDWCEQNKVPCFRGHPTNLTQRYLDCAVRFDSDPIVRITADCPLLQPELIQIAVKQFQGGYLGFHGWGGLNIEVFDLKTLKGAATHGEDEHCTTWMRAQPFAKDVEPLALDTAHDYQRLLAL